MPHGCWHLGRVALSLVALGRGGGIGGEHQDRLKVPPKPYDVLRRVDVGRAFLVRVGDALEIVALEADWEVVPLPWR